MRYNQPFDQPTSPDAPFVNGDPSSSQSGSIPPAAALEYPQREIVAAIAAAGLAPDNADLKQLLRAIRSGQLFTFTDQSGSANSIVIAPGVAHTAISKGLPFRIFPAYTNTAAAVNLQVNTLTAALSRHDGTALKPGDIVAGTPFDCVSDGGGFRLLGFAVSDVQAIAAAGSTASRTYHQAGDAAVAIAATDARVATSAPLTAPRTWTLPAASSVSPTTPIILDDPLRTVSGTNTITLAKTGSDTVAGQSSITLTAPGFQLMALSDGVSNWSFAIIDIVQLQNLLTSATSGLEKGWRLVQKATADSPIAASDHQRVEVDVTAGNATVYLPNTPTKDVQVDVYRRGTSSNSLTVTTASGASVFAFNDGTTDTGIVMGSDTQLNIVGLYADGSVYRCNPGIVI